jgi:PadR family transcriptional regulator, regulatory protein PadR
MGRKPRRISDETAAVLSLFVQEPRVARYGLEIVERSGIPSGSLYPILVRLEGRGILEGQWEDIDEAQAGRRRRRYHRITGGGLEYARTALAEWRSEKTRRQLSGWLTPEPRETAI